MSAEEWIKEAVTIVIACVAGAWAVLTRAEKAHEKLERRQDQIEKNSMTRQEVQSEMAELRNEIKELRSNEIKELRSEINQLTQLVITVKGDLLLRMNMSGEDCGGCAYKTPRPSND